MMHTIPRRRIPDSALVRIENKKRIVPISDVLREYLAHFDRTAPIGDIYSDLLQFDQAIPIETEDGASTHWDWVFYPAHAWGEISRRLVQIYAHLKTPEDPEFTDHLSTKRVEFCHFGNSRPFRIKIVNRFNDNHDYYYVKQADASRVYGLELEHILAPNRIYFLVDGATLIEEHISGIPGDVYFARQQWQELINPTRFAKEFVKFAERCFAKLLGDMRSYNYVIVVTEDFDMQQYRIRAIDFDQQSNEGRLQVYLPHFYRENQPAVDLVWNQLSDRAIRQYQKEERALMARRLRVAWSRTDDLFHCMENDHLSDRDNVVQLARGLARYHRERVFDSATSIGQLTRQHLTTTLREDL